MKIVQSLWVKPSLGNKNVNSSDRNKGGWLDKKYHYMSWALSCLQFRKYYDEVELVTDSLGYDLLINKLELPYTKINVCLDDLNGYHNDLWALGKIHAYSLQNEPFIHADGDVFIFKKFEKDFENSPLIAQNIEKGFVFYDDIFTKIKKNFDYMPDVLIKSKKKSNKIIAANAGLLGGTDINFFKDYAKEAFKFIDNNISGISNLDKLDVGMVNIIYEQFFFHALAEKNQIDINYYLSDVNHTYDGLADFVSLPSKGNFIHALGYYKRLKHTEDALAFRLQNDYPEYYYKILNLLRTNQI